MQRFDENYQFGFHDKGKPVYATAKGLSEKTVEEISHIKKEPEWMRQKRLLALKIFYAKKLPMWGGDLTKINFDNIYYYVKPTDKQGRTWDEVPFEIKNTFDKIGIPEAEKKFLAGVGAQYDCVTEDTLVYANPSVVPIKNLVPGSYVYALDEFTFQLTKQKVLRVVNKGKRNIFSVRVAGRIINCTINHPLLVLRHKKDPCKKRGKIVTSWEYLRDIREGDYIAIIKDTPDSGKPFELPRISFNKSYISKNQYGDFSVKSHMLYTRTQSNLKIPQSTNETLLWLIGLYLGDGYITKFSKDSKNEVLSIAIPKSDALTRKKLQTAFQEIFAYKLTDKQDQFRIRVKSQPIIKLFTKLGLRGTAKTKEIPGWVFGLPKSQKLALIAGLIDSDGTVRHTGKTNDACITSINNEMLKKVQTIGITCGLHITGIHEFRYKLLTNNSNLGKIGYRLQITGDLSSLSEYSQKVKKYFHPKRFYHKYGSYKRKSIKKLISDQVGFAPIQEIKPLGEENVYDIEVEGKHNFIANGVVVHNSEVIYHSISKMLGKKGVIFVDTDTALQKYPEIFKKYFGTVIPAADNKLAALNSAVWSGGSFIYVPPGVHIELPLQAYFRINAKNMGQFERTLIIADEGSYVHYVEGCTAPIYTTDSLHSAVVEIIVKKGARVRYTTIQNWSKNVYNLVTKRMFVEEEGFGEWIDGNLGSQLTMKYPSIYLKGRKSRGEVLSLAFAGEGQHQDAGGKAIHLAPETTSVITSKSISKNGGRTSYRGLLKVIKGAKNSKSTVRCDALILDPKSRSDTYPTMEIDEERVTIGHEASVSKIGEEQLFYFQSRGIPQAQAEVMIVNGFVEPIVRELPMEYAVELNRLIQLEMTGAVG